MKGNPAVDPICRTGRISLILGELFGTGTPTTFPACRPVGLSDGYHRDLALHTYMGDYVSDMRILAATSLIQSG
jgi:hypothetical protein